jgi:adenylate kinase family enzyme
MNVLLVGPPGSGKGTQGERLAHRLDLEHIAAGDLLRAEVAAATPLGLKVRKYLDRGELVPDELIIDLIVPAINRAAHRNGYVLDGFPRSVPQAREARRIAEEQDMAAGAVFYLDMPREQLVRRLLVRAGIGGRADDTPEVVTQRLEVFEQATRPLVDYYRDRGVLTVIDADRSPDEVTDDLIRHLTAAGGDRVAGDQVSFRARERTVEPMTETSTAVAAAVARYAERMHAAVGTGHHVASPLGAWLVLALAAPAATGDHQDRLADALGMSPAEAAHVARRLLEEPHPVIAAAAAVWHRERVETDALRGWLATLPKPVQRGDVPDQATADAWARRVTRDMIQRFPIDLDPSVVLVLASALATKVTWRQPFDVVPASALGGGPWVRTLRRVLRSPESGHESYLAETDRAGRVAVHVSRDEEGLAVTAVVADESVAVGDVLAAAHQVAAEDAARTSLFDLPLGEAPLWRVSEAVSRRPGRQEECRALLPAWSARSTHELAGAPGLGFDDAAEALIALLPSARWDYDARQSAYARYSREGFEAAAVTALGMRLAAVHPGDGVKRTAELRFPHPYAVVATVESEDSPWDGLPVFSAWVADPEDAEDGPD